MLVSIIMPYFKKKKYVKYSVLSVLNQSFQNFELIIVYDNHNKSELRFINKIKTLDKRIKIIRNKSNIGAGLSRNVGIDFSKGTYLAFLDADDLWKKNKLREQIKFMKLPKQKLKQQNQLKRRNKYQNQNQRKLELEQNCHLVLMVV